MISPTIAKLKKFKHSKGDTRNYWFDGISTYVVRAIFNTSITPIQVNLCVTVVGLIMGIAFLAGSLFGKIFGILLFFLYIILDATDGQLARARKDVSLKGEYLDKMGHYIVYPFVSFSIGYASFQLTNEMITLWAGFGMSIAMTLSSASKDCFISVYKVPDSQVRKLRKKLKFRLKEVILKIVRFEIFIYMVVVAGIIDYFTNTSITISNYHLNIESIVIIIYSILLLVLNAFKTYLFFKKERLIRSP